MVTYENLFQYTIMLITLVGICYQIFTRKKINRQSGPLMVSKKKQNKDDRKISSSFPFLGYHTDSQKSVISCQAFHYGATNL